MQVHLDDSSPRDSAVRTLDLILLKRAEKRTDDSHSNSGSIQGIALKLSGYNKLRQEGYWCDLQPDTTSNISGSGLKTKSKTSDFCKPFFMSRESRTDIIIYLIELSINSSSSFKDHKEQVRR